MFCLTLGPGEAVLLFFMFAILLSDGQLLKIIIYSFRSISSYYCIFHFFQDIQESKQEVTKTVKLKVEIDPFTLSLKAQQTTFINIFFIVFQRK